MLNTRSVLYHFSGADSVVYVRCAVYFR